MADQTAIEWCDSTFNPWSGCTKVSPGCDHCYAESWSGRAGAKVGKWGPGAPRVRTTPANWRKPVKWNADGFLRCTACNWRGERKDTVNFGDCPLCEGRVENARRRVFCASLADVFDNEVPPEWRADLFSLIAATPSLDWLLLTKRIGNVMSMIPEAWAKGRLPKQALLGATMVNQDECDRDLRKLLAVPAYRHFLSLEPLLGAVNLDIPVGHDGKALVDWVIVGGESGHHARPMSIQWARALRNQCAAAGVPFLFKQWGEWAPAGVRPSETPGRFAFGDWGHDPARFTLTDRYPRAFTSFGARCILEHVGKKAAGRLLDGRTHDGFPGVANG